MNFIGRSLKPPVFQCLLILSISPLAQAELATTATTAEALQQQNTEITREIQRLETELRRLQALKHCESTATPFANQTPQHRWQFMTEQYGLPIVGF
ncbi:MAG: hypothetical protein ABL903_13895 [Methylococcales bacterium]